MSLGRLVDATVASGKVRAAELTITTTCSAGLLLSDDRESAERALTGPDTAHPGEDEERQWRRDLSDILAACTKLEKLSLFYCGSGHGTLWQVRHARLEDIRISRCAIYGVDLVWLPTLERFVFQGWSSTTQRLVSFGHVPRLTTVTLSNDIGDGEQTLKLSRILANTSSTLTDLRLNFKGDNIWIQPETSRRLTDAFRNLKTLKIRNVHHECGLAWIMFLLQSAPHLQELYIKLMNHDCVECARKNVPWEVAPSFKHYNLAMITILGFYSTEETIVTFIRHLVQAAVKLKKICIRENAASFCYLCGHTELPAGSRFPRTYEKTWTLSEKRIGAYISNLKRAAIPQEFHSKLN
ncbi:unnamed protein product [Urochloa decumbens]|uniref:At1g61320/AtMIF1 LRR domain-containing protein n=1 Tax=Urochloa decumbens TaxID=240449 RepID=A0ABC9BVM9_9POAL